MNPNGDFHQKYRPLYLANSIEQLRGKAETAFLKTNPSLKRCIEWMKKWDAEAKNARRAKDQELEFLYIYRYMNALVRISSFPEYKKNVHYQRELDTSKLNLKIFENLQDSLITRYKERSDKPASGDNNNVKNKTLPNNSQPSKSPLEEIKSEVNKPTIRTQSGKRAPEELSSTSIDCSRLYSLIKENSASLLVLDTRPKKHFEESHLTFSNVINISSEIIRQGDSASALGEKLLGADKTAWSRRHTYDVLVVLDWSSTEMSLQSPINWLREAMVKWDPSLNYRSPPLILEGGFEEWLMRYPHLTTNPKVEPPSTNSSSINFLDSCDYPMDDLEVVKQNIIPAPVIPEPVLFQSPLRVDRSTKPKLKHVTKPEVESMEGIEEAKDGEDNPPTEQMIISDKEPSSISVSSISSDNSGSPEEPQKDYPPVESQKVDRQLKPNQVQEDNAKMLEALRRVKPNQTKSSVPPMDTMKGSADEDVSYNSVSLKRDGGLGSNLKRSSSSPNIAQDLRDEDTPMKQPSFTRLNKPRYSEKTDATYGSTDLGLTGLKNFANNCYMNSILQCLSNTEALVKELINLKQPEINSQSKTKGRVALEVIHTLRSMWSGEIKVYSIKELKELMGNIKDIFKGTGHQDSNEFLIILLEHLHEDLKVQDSIVTLSGASEDSGEKAWGEFKRKNSSVIQRLFYGQQKSTVTCATCNHSSVTFEPFFNLFVPIPSTASEKVTLMDCIQLYMSGENITGWKCPKCQAERNATKKFDMSKLPPILIIALKRFTQEDDSWLHKKEKTVTYPLYNLDMRPFTVTNSEQRYTNYDLYAVSTHSGTLKSGHYKAICKNSVASKPKWYMFDDQFVDSLSAQRVKDHPDAYILFYSAVKN